MKSGVVAPLRGGIQQKLVAGLSGDLVGRELQEYLDIDAHLEGFDCHAFSVRKMMVECHKIGLKHANGECPDNVIGRDA